VHLVFAFQFVLCAFLLSEGQRLVGLQVAIYLFGAGVSIQK